MAFQVVVEILVGVMFRAVSGQEEECKSVQPEYRFPCIYISAICVYDNETARRIHCKFVVDRRIEKELISCRITTKKIRILIHSESLII